MQVNFAYDKAQDAWCLLSKGRSSNNSQNPTEQYEQLVARYGENPSAEDVEVFVGEYVAENQIDVPSRVAKFQRDWEEISGEFQKRAEAIFGAPLVADIAAYLTVNGRCPYSVEDGYFFVSLRSNDARPTAMHELWHFYTWHGLGADQEARLGKQRYNDLKEALTVLLNVECADLFPGGATDAGYPQHRSIREKILEYWKEEKSIARLWERLLN